MSQPDWEAIERAYRAGSLSIRAIAERYGTSESTIRSRASRNGWQRDLTEQVKAATKTKLSRKVSQPSPTSPQLADRFTGTSMVMNGLNPQAPTTDIEAARERCALAGLPYDVYGHLHLKNEAFISGVFRLMALSGNAHNVLFDDSVPEIIKAESEFNVPGGRVDYLLIHRDGSITVCEVKCGQRGKQNVLSGVGQCIAYAIQIGMANAGVPKIRKALVFSSWDKPSEELIVIDACRAAGVIPVPMGNVDAHRAKAIGFIERKISNGNEKAH